MKEFFSDPFNKFVSVAFLVCIALVILLIIAFPISSTTERDFKYRNAFVETCLESELYNREECIQLAGKQ